MEDIVREIRDLKTALFYSIWPTESITFTITCFRLGVHRYILKPFKVKEIEEALDAAMAKFRHWDELQLLWKEKVLKKSLKVFR